MAMATLSVKYRETKILPGILILRDSGFEDILKKKNWLIIVIILVAAAPSLVGHKEPTGDDNMKITVLSKSNNKRLTRYFQLRL